MAAAAAAKNSPSSFFGYHCRTIDTVPVCAASPRHQAQLANMATVLGTLTSLNGYHLIAWGSLLGMQLYQVALEFFSFISLPNFQITTLITDLSISRTDFWTLESFVMTKVCYLYLPRPQFTSLQKRAFPVYFRLGTALAFATAVTYPSGSIFALASNSVDSVLLGLTIAMSGLNLLVYGPKTSDAMVQRTHQGQHLIKLQLLCILSN